MSTNQHEFIPDQCEHILDTGIRCGSPAIRQQDFCYYHRRAHSNILPGDSRYILPILETEQAIQLAVTHILRALLKGKLDRRDAATYFQGIRIAQATLKNTKHDLINENLDYIQLELTDGMERIESQGGLQDELKSELKDVDGSRSPSSDQPVASSTVASAGPVGIAIAAQEQAAQHEVILTASAANRKDLCTSAPTTKTAPRNLGGDSKQPRRARRLAQRVLASKLQEACAV